MAKTGSGWGLLVQHPAAAVEVPESFRQRQLCVEAVTQSHKEALGVRPGGDLGVNEGDLGGIWGS